ncbi:hypothetical protein ACLOJK_026312, partial [Asimina triloba]
MEISVIADVVSTVQTHGLGLAKFLLRSHHNGVLSAARPTVAISTPTIQSHGHRSATRTLVRRMPRTRRRSRTAEEGADGGDDGFFGSGGDGPFGGSGGGGKGWNFGSFGGSNWEDSSSSPSYSDPAFDFVYEVLSWIVLSNCMHFAFKRAVRIVAGGAEDPSREKVPMRLAALMYRDLGWLSAALDEAIAQYSLFIWHFLMFISDYVSLSYELMVDAIDGFRQCANNETDKKDYVSLPYELMVDAIDDFRQCANNESDKK